MKIAMIMLAAGNSRRFGANKLLYEIDGIPMYRHVLEQLDDTKKKIENIYSEYSDITEDNNNDNNNDNNSDIVQLNNLYRNNITAKIICNIIVITQYDAIAEAVKTKEIQVLYNPHPEDGISSSVKIGLNASLDADAVLFTVSDQPWLTSETICELIHVFLNTSKGIACVSCQGKMGNPCIFDRKYYNELLSLEGDKGGKKVIMKHLDDTQIYEIEAGRELEDAELKASLKDAGIGTPATRAAIIETLFARQYIVREKKNLVPTDKGLAVYKIVRDKKIADVEMTGMWETALAKIEAGSMDADTFRKGIEVYAAQITAELLSVQLSIANGETCSCPKCGSGRILFYPKVAKCSNVDCTLTIFRNKCDKQLSDKQIVELVTKRKTGLIKGFKGKNDKAFDASLVLDEQFNVGFSFPEKQAKPKK